MQDSGNTLRKAVLAEQPGNPGIVFFSHGSATDLAKEISQWFADDTRYVLKSHKMR